MAGEYQDTWANALDKLQDEELYRLANNFIKEKDLAIKNQLMLDRVQLDGDIKHAITFGGDYDSLINQIGFHQKRTNDAAWSQQQIRKVQSAKSAEMGLNDALSNLTRLSGELQRLNPEDSTSGETVNTIMGDVQGHLANLRKMKQHQLATSHQKTFAEDVKLFQALQSMQVWDVNRGPGSPGIQIAPDDPARVAKETAIRAGKLRNRGEVERAILDIPEQQHGDPQKFTYEGMTWEKAPQGVQDTPKGKQDILDEKLKEYKEGSGKWYSVTEKGTGATQQQKVLKEENASYDKAVRNMVADVQSAHGLEGLSDDFKNDVVGHPLKSYVGGDFASDDSRRRLKKNIASTIKMWFSGKTAEGKDTYHDMDAPWIEKAMKKARSQKKDIEGQIKYVMSRPEWQSIVGEGNPGLKDAFDWPGTGTDQEESANQYFLKTIELYGYLNKITGKKGGDLIDSLMNDEDLTIDEEKWLQQLLKDK